MNDHIHSSEQGAHTKNVDAYILRDSDSEHLSSRVDDLFGDDSSFDLSAKAPDAEELQLYNVNSLRKQQISGRQPNVSSLRQIEPDQVFNQQMANAPANESYIPMPSSALHSVIEEETIEFNASSPEQAQVVHPPEKNEEKKQKLFHAFESEEFSKTSLIDSTLHNLICTEPFLSVDDLLFLLKKDEFIGRHISRKVLKKALRRNNLSTSYERFRMYMAG